MYTIPYYPSGQGQILILCRTSSQCYCASKVGQKPYLSPQSLQKPIQQHLLVEDFEQGVVQEEPLPAGTLHKLVDDDSNHQVEHDKVDAKDEGDAVDG